MMKPKSVLVALLKRRQFRAACAVFCQEVSRASESISKAGAVGGSVSSDRSLEVAKLGLSEMWEKLFDEEEPEMDNIMTVATLTLLHHVGLSESHSQFFRDVVNMFSDGWLDFGIGYDERRTALEWYLCHPVATEPRGIPAFQLN